MNGALEALLKFLTEFTWRKLLGIFVIGLLFFIGLLVYERYTSSFRLSRLQKATELLSNLQKIPMNGLESSPEFETARRELLTQVTQAIQEKPLSLKFIPSELAVSVEDFWKFAAGGAFWWIIALFHLPRISRKENRNTIYGSVSFALVAGVVAIFVQPIWWPWFHLFIYPWLFIAAVVTILIPFLIPALQNAKSKAKEITCINNLKQVGLAAHIWANENRSGLPPDLISMKKELGTEKATTCPADPKVTYEILSPGIKTADPFTVYAQCPFHKHVILADGSVQRLQKRRITQQNGHWILINEQSK